MQLTKRNGRILDLGCADGFYSRAIASSENQIIGIDTNPNYLQCASPDENPCFLQASGEGLPFKDCCFDSVLCVDVIEHVEDDKELLSEISRVLKPEGQLVLSVPNSKFPLTYDPLNIVLKPLRRHLPIGIWGFGHRRLYSTAALENVLSQHNLKVVEINYLTHSLAALCENYLSTVFQWAAENQKPKQWRIRSSQNGNFFYNLAYNMTRIIVSIDRKLLAKSRRSVGLAVLAVKL